MVYYLDSSAAAKFVVVESGSLELEGWVAQTGATFATSLLTRVELLRFARRYGVAAVAEMDDFWVLLDVIPFLERIADLAGRLTPGVLRSLDAIHLATAIDLGPALSGVVTYDKRLAEACALHGLEVIAPA